MNNRPASSWGPFTLLWEYRSVLWATLIHDLRQRYGASVFGLAWTVLFPILFLGLYSLVFNLILQVRIPGKSSLEYTLIIFSGLIPFLGFSEALSSGVSSLVDNRSLLKGSVFPVELIAVKTVLVSSVTMLTGLAILLCVVMLKGEGSLSQLALPFAFFVQFIFSVGLVWTLSIFAVFFRDIINVVSPVILFLMLVSPIGYTEEMIPAQMMPIMALNPLYYMISIYRDIIHGGQVPWTSLLSFGAFSCVLYIVGYRLFRRLKVVAADYV